MFWGGHLFPKSYISQVTYFPKKTKKTHIFPKKFGKYVTWEIYDFPVTSQVTYFPSHIFPKFFGKYVTWEINDSTIEKYQTFFRNIQKLRENSVKTFGLTTRRFFAKQVFLVAKLWNL